MGGVITLTERTHDVVSDRTGRRFEITPAMIEAGVDQLADYDPNGDTAETAVSLIFRAMIKAGGFQDR
jgi:hypothetical protein